MRFALLLSALLSTACGSVCEGALYSTSQGICIVEQSQHLDASSDEIDEYIQTVQELFIEYSEFSQADLDQVYRSHEIALAFTPYDVRSTGACWLDTWTNQVEAQVEVMHPAQLINTALAHELLHAWLMPMGENDHPAPYFGPGSIEHKINTALSAKYIAGRDDYIDAWKEAWGE